MRLHVKPVIAKCGYAVSGMGFKFFLQVVPQNDGRTLLECDAVRRAGDDLVIYLGITVSGLPSISADVLETLVARELVEHWDFNADVAE